ncbi:hypothetical protein Mapa_011533 [Marchantia paleacea]|nr:hypothetical protein Mapa_011533 [Marchantia paleacea]
MAPPNIVRVLNIPHVVEEGELLQFLEDALGENTIKSCNILRHQDTGRSKGKGFVQFRDGGVMAAALEISNEGKLSIYNQELKLLVPDNTLVQQTSPTYFNLEHCKLYVGCLTSSGTMLSFWRYVGSLKVEINSEEETLSMQLGFTTKDYKMEFPYSEIWQLTAAHLNGRNQGFSIQG